MATGDHLSGVKRPDHEADHPPSTSVEVENTWIYTLTIHTQSWRRKISPFLVERICILCYSRDFYEFDVNLSHVCGNNRNVRNNWINIDCFGLIRFKISRNEIMARPTLCDANWTARLQKRAGYISHILQKRRRERFHSSSNRKNELVLCYKQIYETGICKAQHFISNTFWKKIYVLPRNTTLDFDAV
jgi:hypothetical protein